MAGELPWSGFHGAERDEVRRIKEETRSQQGMVCLEFLELKKIFFRLIYLSIVLEFVFLFLKVKKIFFKDGISSYSYLFGSA